MGILSYSETLKSIRKVAKENGLIFKKNGKELNRVALYTLVDRWTGRVYVDDYKITTAFSDACSGFFETVKGENLEN